MMPLAAASVIMSRRKTERRKGRRLSGRTPLNRDTPLIRASEKQAGSYKGSIYYLCERSARTGDGHGIGGNRWVHSSVIVVTEIS